MPPLPKPPERTNMTTEEIHARNERFLIECATQLARQMGETRIFLIEISPGHIRYAFTRNACGRCEPYRIVRVE